MNGVIVVRTLLVGDTGVTALVSEARIAAGMLPQGTDLPAISLMSVSSVDRNIPAPGTKRRVTERVQVTVLARTYPETKAILAAIRTAAADQMPGGTAGEKTAADPKRRLRWAGPNLYRPALGELLAAALELVGVMG